MDETPEPSSMETDAALSKERLVDFKWSVVTIDQQFRSENSLKRNNDWIVCFQRNRLETFKSLLQKEFAAAHVQSLSIADVTTAVNQGEDSTQFSSGEIRSALNSMMDANQLMVSEDRVFLI